MRRQRRHRTAGYARRLVEITKKKEAHHVLRHSSTEYNGYTCNRRASGTFKLFTELPPPRTSGRAAGAVALLLTMQRLRPDKITKGLSAKSIVSLGPNRVIFPKIESLWNPLWIIEEAARRVLVFDLQRGNASHCQLSVNGYLASKRGSHHFLHKHPSKAEKVEG